MYFSQLKYCSALLLLSLTARPAIAATERLVVPPIFEDFEGPAALELHAVPARGGLGAQWKLETIVPAGELGAGPLVIRRVGIREDGDAHSEHSERRELRASLTLSATPRSELDAVFARNGGDEPYTFFVVGRPGDSRPGAGGHGPGGRGAGGRGAIVYFFDLPGGFRFDASLEGNLHVHLEIETNDTLRLDAVPAGARRLLIGEDVLQRQGTLESQTLVLYLQVDREISVRPMQPIVTPGPLEVASVPRDVAPEPRQGSSGALGITPEPRDVAPAPRESAPVPPEVAAEPLEVAAAPLVLVASDRPSTGSCKESSCAAQPLDLAREVAKASGSIQPAPASAPEAQALPASVLPASSLERTVARLEARLGHLEAKLERANQALAAVARLAVDVRDMRGMLAHWDAERALSRGRPSLRIGRMSVEERQLELEDEIARDAVRAASASGRDVRLAEGMLSEAELRRARGELLPAFEGYSRAYRSVVSAEEPARLAEGSTDGSIDALASRITMAPRYQPQHQAGERP